MEVEVNASELFEMLGVRDYEILQLNKKLAVQDKMLKELEEKFAKEVKKK